MEEPRMNKEVFQKRLSALYSNWSSQKQDLWGNSDVIVIHSQENSSASSEFYSWLIGEQLVDATTIFTPCAIYMLCTQKNFSKIRPLCCYATLTQRIPVSVQLKPKKDDDGLALIDATIRQARNNKAALDDPFVVGSLSGEYPKSKLFLSCINGLEPKMYQAATVNSGLANLINNKPCFGVGGSYTPRPTLMDATKAKPLLSNLDSKAERVEGENGIDSISRVKNDENILLSSSISSEQNKLRIPDQLFSLEGNKNAAKVFKTLQSVAQFAAHDEQCFEKQGNKNVDKVFKFGATNSIESRNTNQVFKFGANRLDGKAKEGEERGDQLLNIIGANRLDGKEDTSFIFGANKLDDEQDKAKNGEEESDQLFKFGVNSKQDISKKRNKNRDESGAILKSEANRLEEKSKEDGDKLFKFGEANKDKFEGSLIKETNKYGGKLERKMSKQGVDRLDETMTALYSSWRKYKEEQWEKADVLVITTQALSHSLSSSFLVWLLDHEFPDTTAIFSDTRIEFLCTKGSFSMLRAIGVHMTMVANVPVSVQLKKGGEPCVDWLKKTLCQVAKQCPLVVGCIKGEIEGLPNSKMFEFAGVDNALINLLEKENLKKFAGEQSTLPKHFQMSLGKSSAATAVSSSELASRDDLSQKSLPEQKGDTASSRPEVVEDNVPSKLEEEGDFTRKLVSWPNKLEEDKIYKEDPTTKWTLPEKKEGQASIIEDGAQEKQLVEEEKNKLLRGDECGEQSRLTAQDGIDSSTSDDVNGRDLDDNWTLIERECEGQETEVAEKFSWKRWFIG